MKKEKTTVTHHLPASVPVKWGIYQNIAMQHALDLSNVINIPWLMNILTLRLLGYKDDEAITPVILHANLCVNIIPLLFSSTRGSRDLLLSILQEAFQIKKQQI